LLAFNAFCLGTAGMAEECFGNVRGAFLGQNFHGGDIFEGRSVRGTVVLIPMQDCKSLSHLGELGHISPNDVRLT